RSAAGNRRLLDDLQPSGCLQSASPFADSRRSGATLLAGVYTADLFTPLPVAPGSGSARRRIGPLLTGTGQHHSSWRNWKLFGPIPTADRGRITGQCWRVPSLPRTGIVATGTGHYTGHFYAQSTVDRKLASTAWRLLS